MKTNALFIIILIAFTSCYEDIKLDLRDTAPRVVIEGQVTDKVGAQFVKLSYSSGFYSPGATPKITNGVVTVADNEGQVVEFLHNSSNHPDSMGYYKPQVPFVGMAGRQYTLKVQLDEKEYSATDTFLPVVLLDSITQGISSVESEDPKEEGRVHEIKIYVREPKDQVNFYLFKFYRNDTLLLYSDNDVYYSDDELLGADINGYPSPVYYKPGETARVEMISMTRAGFVFYNDLNILLNNDAGGMFGPIPAAPRSNVTNGALGFFQVGGISAKSMIIKP